MTEVTNQLMYEVLKSIQARIDTVDKNVKELVHGQIRLREDLNNFHRDTIRLEVQFIEVSKRLERIERRFEVVDVN